MSGFKRKITATDYSKIPETYLSVFSYLSSERLDHLKLQLTFDNLKKENLLHADHEYLVFEVEKEYRGLFWFIMGFTFLFFLLFVVTILSSKTDEEIPMYVWVWTPLLTIFITTSFIYYFKRPKKEFILDRINGLITFPDYLWRSNNTMHIKNMKWCTFTPRHGGVQMYPQLNIKSPKTYFFSYTSMMYFENVTIDFYSSRKYLPEDKLMLILWYMDKNRPLPPGALFDEYRTLDFDRRQAEGFPRPLFFSPFPTLEVTPEQQEEREKYWRDPKTVIRNGVTVTI